jgi:hypothetical protein
MLAVVAHTSSPMYLVDRDRMITWHQKSEDSQGNITRHCLKKKKTKPAMDWGWGSSGRAAAHQVKALSSNSSAAKKHTEKQK